jgi:hypothetical protein
MKPLDTVLSVLIQVPIVIGAALLAEPCGFAGAPTDDPLKTMAPADASYISKYLPGIVTGPVKDIAPLTDAETWYPLEEIKFEFDRVSSKGKSAQLVLEKIELAPGLKGSKKDAGWAIELPNGTTRYLDSKTNMGIVVPTDIAKSYGLIIRLDPPEPIVHENSKHNEPITREIDVSIYSVSDPTSISHSGKVKCTWTDLGGWRVKVPMGTYDTHLIRIEYNGSIGPASVNAKKYMFIAEGIGPVAFTDSREISAFFFYNNDTDHTGVLRKMTRKK